MRQPGRLRSQVWSFAFLVVRRVLSFVVLALRWAGKVGFGERVDDAGSDGVDPRPASTEIDQGQPEWYYIWYH